MSGEDVKPRIDQLGGGDTKPAAASLPLTTVSGNTTTTTSAGSAGKPGQTQVWSIQEA